MLIYDLANPQELLGFVRNIPFSQFTLDQFLPVETLNDIEYRFTRSDLIDQEIAPYRAWDAEAAIGSRQGLSRIMGEIPPISKKIRLGEEQRLRLRSLQIGGDTTDLVNQIFDDSALMTRSVQGRIEVARGRALYDGKFVVNENGFVQTLDFEVPGGDRVVPGTLWSDTVNAKPVDDLRAWVDAYVAVNGFKPGYALGSTPIVTNLLKNAEIRTLSATIAGTPGLVTRSALDATLVEFELPPLVVYDAFVQSGGSRVRVVPSGHLVFLPPPDQGLGSTFMGITAEALELAGAGQITTQQAPGIISVVDKTFDPVSLWTKVAAVAIPVIANPRMLLISVVQADT